MEWLYYLLEANLYLLLFYGFYRLFLANETFYNNNRYYLLLSCLSAFILPVLQLGFLNPAPVVDNVLFPPPILLTAEQLAATAALPIQKQIDYMSYLYPIYLFIAFCFTTKLIFSLYKIIIIWLRSKKVKTGNITLIELNGQATAFSFFNLLFIHPHLAEKETVMSHEMVHIKQKHSLDILFFEILQIACWFNPIIYFIKKDIKLLHEYIADDLSTRKGIQKHKYAMFLIENSFGVVATPLTNQIFNQSILKRRINMLNKKRTAGWARLKMLLTLPLVGGMLCISTMAFTKDYGYVDLLPEKSKAAETVQQEALQVEKGKKQAATKAYVTKKDKVKFPPPIVKPDQKQWFTPLYSKDKTTGKPVLKENRYIVINGNPIKDLNMFYGVANAESVKYLNIKSAVEKYGDYGKNGAVEITGKNMKYFDKVTIPFPPPAVEPPPPGYKTKRDRIKFPPPIVKPDSKNLEVIVPDNPALPSKKNEKDQVKFPPPIVKSNKFTDQTVRELMDKAEASANLVTKAQKPTGNISKSHKVSFSWTSTTPATKTEVLETKIINNIDSLQPKKNN